MSSTRMTVPNDDAQPLALRRTAVDIAQQLERLRQIETELALIIRPSIKPVSAEEAAVPPRPSRRRLLRRRSAD